MNVEKSEIVQIDKYQLEDIDKMNKSISYNRIAIQ